MPIPIIPQATEETENGGIACPRCIVKGGAILITLGLIEIPILAAGILAVRLSGGAAIEPLVVVFTPVEIVIANFALIGVEYIAQGVNRSPEEIDIDYLPLLHLVTDPNIGKSFR